MLNNALEDYMIYLRKIKLSFTVFINGYRFNSTDLHRHIRNCLLLVTICYHSIHRLIIQSYNIKAN